MVCEQKVLKKGLIFDIRRYSVHDGPGIRTTVFLKGCPLRCVWCHNPEGLLQEQQVIRRERSLDGHRTICEEIVGTWYTTGEVLAEIQKDVLFYEESGGGVTFSGGEPLLQSDFLAEMLLMCREAGIHTAVDTSAYADAGIFTKIVRLTDLVLFDMKCLDDETHLKWTGAGNKLILANLESLKGMTSERTHSPKLIIRIPIIPGVNDNYKEMHYICDYLSGLDISLEKIELLPYHKLGRNKYEAMGMTAPELVKPTDKSISIKEIRDMFHKLGFNV